MSGILYLVPTPIGNLGDLTLRAVEILRQVDAIAAEDTRVTRKLLSHLEIKKPLLTYHRHNTRTGSEPILCRLREGKDCALVTDAGTPAISDPGEELVALCAEAGIPVVALPGPCALVTALSVSGLPTGRFTFEGFLATNRKNRRAHIQSLVREERTMIFYEAPHKLLATLTDLAEAFGPQRPVALCRELTKLHEEVLRTTLGQALEHFSATPPRGEFVLVVGGCPPKEEEPDLVAGLALLARLRREEGLSRRDAAKQAAQSLGLSRNVLYEQSMREESAEK